MEMLKLAIISPDGGCTVKLETESTNPLTCSYFVSQDGAISIHLTPMLPGYDYTTTTE